MASETNAEHARRCDHKVNHRAEDCPNRESERPTTAQILGGYRRQLSEQGFDPDQIRSLVIEAARTLLRDDGLYVGHGWRDEAAHLPPA